MFSMEVEVKSGDANLGEIFAQLEGEAEAVFEAPHAAAVEFGTEPHYPPVGPLIVWARNKLGLSPKKAKRAGYAIQQKIFKEGTLPQPYFRPAIAQFQSELDVLIKEGLNLEDMVDLIIQYAQDNIKRKGISDVGTLLASGKFRRLK